MLNARYFLLGICVGVLFVLHPLQAQVHEGTRFWVGFMEHVDKGENACWIYISAQKETKGVIRIPGISYEKSFSVGPGEITEIQLPAEVEVKGSESREKKGVYIETDQPVAVHAHQVSLARSDAALVLPVISLGKDYVAVSHEGHFEDGKGHPSEFLIVAAHPGTEVYIHPTSRTKRNRGPGRPITVKLDPGDTYQVQGAHHSDDLTGSRITSNKPIAVFSGNQWTQVPSACRAPDNLFCQLQPMETAGDAFVVLPHAQSAFCLVRIIAARTGTEVFINGKFVASLFEGEYWETKVYNTPMYINTSRPVMVARYLPGHACNPDGEETLLGDPALHLVNHLRQSIQTTVFLAPSRSRISFQDVEILVRDVDQHSVRIDGEPVTGFMPVDVLPGYMWTHVRVSLGKHTLKSGGCGVSAYLVGTGRLESYAFSLGTGFSLKPFAADAEIPEGGCLTDTFTFLSGVDPYVAETRWDFGDDSVHVGPFARHHYEKPGAYDVKLILHNVCLDRADTLFRTVVVSPPLQVNTMRDTMICAGDTLHLRASLTPGADYFWTGPKDFFAATQYPSRFCPDSSFSGVYTVIAATQTGCYSAPGRVKVMVRNVIPDLGKDSTLCPGDTMQLTAPTGWSAYRWQDSSTSENYVVRAAGKFAVEVRDGYGCWATDTVNIQWKCPPTAFLPATFSPNTDGYNEVFQPALDIRAPKFYYFTVLDSTANILFKTRNERNGWDGSDKRGKPVDEGWYQWTLYFEEHEPELPRQKYRDTGWVLLLR